jgi:UDPglucose 6-dehydrogenase
MRVSVIGLGKLGCPLAALLASKGHDVVGADLNPGFVEAINRGQAPVDEPGLQDLLVQIGYRLRATGDCEQAVAESDATFIIVPTPSGPDGRFSNRYMLEALRATGRALRHKPDYHLVVVTSTVMPGSTGGELRQALEQSSGRRVGDTLGLCYNPEFIALGSVIRDMLRPDFILIGESDQRAGDVLEAVYQEFCENQPPVRRMNFVNAELTKISVNTFVTTKISYANMLADICDRLPGADVDVVTGAIGADSRIGAKYLRGAVGYGGPCFPRDNVAFSALARHVGAKADIAEATDRINRFQVERLVSVVQMHMPRGGRVGILGLSYKPNTGVIEESQSVQLAAFLARDGYSVTVYDPQAMAAAMSVLGSTVSAANTAADCARVSDLLVIATPWSEFREFEPECLKRDGSPVTIIDLWRILPRAAFADIAKVVYIGLGADASAGAPVTVRASSS